MHDEFSEATKMIDPNHASLSENGAGVLELLRHFKRDESAARIYLTGCSQRAEAAESVLKAFQYLPPSFSQAGTGPFSGIPVAVKDIFATSDMPTTNGSAIDQDRVPDRDAWVVERLRALGATIFGKTVTTEFAWRHPGPTVNPWNRKHTPGGSSSGSAASVAAGILPLAIGSQTLGSVVRPAAFNGVVGLKPSFGAIPRVGVHPLSPSLDHVGFFARCVDDAAYALSLLAGSSEDDQHGKSLPPFTVSVETGLVPLQAPRLAVMRFELWSRAEPEQRDLFEATIDTLRQSGAKVQDLQLPELDQTAWNTINTIIASEAAPLFDGYVEHYPDRTSDRLKDLVRIGKSHRAYDYLVAKQRQAMLRSAFTTAMASFDAVLTLPAFGEAPVGLSYTGDAEYCAPWTLLGVPAISLPAGFGRIGLPLGVQLVGAYRQDLHLLRVAKWVENVLAFKPGLPDLQVT